MNLFKENSVCKLFPDNQVWKTAVKSLPEKVKPCLSAAFLVYGLLFWLAEAPSVASVCEFRFVPKPREGSFSKYVLDKNYTLAALQTSSPCGHVFDLLFRLSITARYFFIASAIHFRQIPLWWPVIYVSASIQQHKCSCELVNISVGAVVPRSKRHIVIDGKDDAFFGKIRTTNPFV